ncbi:MAG TPA: hypothetical protein VGI46_11040 [Candidatus Acidoferrum sp.]
MTSSLDYCARYCPPLDETVANSSTPHDINTQYCYAKSPRALASVTASPSLQILACAAKMPVALRVN